MSATRTVWTLSLVLAAAVVSRPCGATWLVEPDHSLTQVPQKYDRTPNIAACGDTLVAVWNRMNFSRSAANYAYSTDGGATWTEGNGFGPNSIDELPPAVCASRNGVFYAVVRWLPQNDYSLAVFRGSLMGGILTWGPPALAVPLGDAYLGPSIACDADGRQVYLAYTRESPGYPVLDYTVRMAWSSDSGATWTDYGALGSSKSNGPNVVVQDDGRVTVAWEEFTPGTMVARTSDPCAGPAPPNSVTACPPTFGPLVTVAPAHDNLRPLPSGGPDEEIHPTLRCLNDHKGNYPRLALDASGGDDSGTIYAVWAAGCEGTVVPGSGRDVLGVENNDWYATAIPMEIGDTAVGDVDVEGSGDFGEIFSFYGERGTTIAVRCSLITGAFCQAWIVDCGDDTTTQAHSFGYATGAVGVPERENPTMIVTLPRTGKYHLWGGVRRDFTVTRYWTSIRRFELSPTSVARDHRDIVLSASRDGGQTWTAPVRVNDTPPWWDDCLASVAVDGEGVVHVVWYGRSGNDACGKSVDVFWAYSMDGGATFGPSERVNRRSLRWLWGSGRYGPGDVGDHLAVAASRRAVHALWTQDTEILTPNYFNDGDVYHALIHPDTTTAVLLSRLAATRAGECVRVAWEFGPGVAVAEACVYRSHPVRSEEVEVGCVGQDAQAASVCDAGFVEGVTYRLRVRFADGRTQWYGPVAVDGAAGHAEPPLRVRPNPSQGTVRLAIETAAFGERLTVDVLDPGGRRVARLYRGPAAGLLELEWDGRGQDGTVPPGVYFLECRGSRGSLRQRIVQLGR